VIFLKKPTQERRAEVRREKEKWPSTFAFVGSTEGDDLPGGFNRDRYRQRLGQGRETFERACNGIRDWRMFPAPWTEIAPVDESLTSGLVVTVTVRVLFVWFLATCRVAYLIEEEDAERARFGFAYATLPGHPEQGEERFLVEWNRSDDSVEYNILAVSRPAVWYTWFGYPFTRLLQRRFGRDSKRSMLAAVGAE